MGIGSHAGPDQAASGSGTLGDVLFADGLPSPPESEWVALVRSIAARDQRALQALYHRTHPIVFSLVMRVTRNLRTAEEVTLDVFHDVWRRACEYDPANGSVLGWVLNQARSRAIDRLRFEQRQKRVDPHSLEAHEPGRGSPDAGAAGPDETIELEEQARLLRGALAKLTPQEREAIEAAYFSGLTYAETAARLEQPLGTVKTRIRSGLDKLRHALVEEARR